MKYQYIFGPVPSRRLGYSLGIDPVPLKVCSYDCVYCEVGRTTLKVIERKEYVKAEKILQELEDFLKSTQFKIDVITFSGSGEPTLNSKIGYMIRKIKELTEIPVAVLTNGSLLWQEEVREELLPADIVIPSLDAVTPKIFMRVNHPHLDITPEKVIGGEIEFRKIYKGKYWLEVLIVKGINDREDEYRKIAGAIKKINPDKVQLNTVVRPPGQGRAEAVSRKELEKLQMIIGDKAEIIPEFHGTKGEGHELSLLDNLLNMLQIRPCTLEELSSVLQVEEDSVKMALEGLKYKNILHEQKIGDKVFYKVEKRKVV